MLFYLSDFIYPWNFISEAVIRTSDRVSILLSTNYKYFSVSLLKIEASQIENNFK